MLFRTGSWFPAPAVSANSLAPTAEVSDYSNNLLVSGDPLLVVFCSLEQVLGLASSFQNKVS